MSTKKGHFKATCPSCGQDFDAPVEVDSAHQDAVQTHARCPHCRSDFDATADLDCLEWDDVCTTEQGRIG